MGDTEDHPPPPRRPGGGAGPPDGSDPCAIRLTTTLNAVDVDVAATLSQGDRLRVERRDTGGFPTVAAMIDGGAVVGTIIDDIEVLLDCLNRGRLFQAAVLQPPDRAVVWVEVTPA